MTQTSQTTQVSHARRNDVGQIITGPSLMSIPSDGYVNGPATYAFTADVTLVAGDIVILNSDSQWAKTDANSASLYIGFKGVVVYGGAADAYILVALPGSIVTLTDFATLTTGTAYYILEVAGTMGATCPTTGTSGKIQVGVALAADTLYVTMMGIENVSGA